MSDPEPEGTAIPILPARDLEAAVALMERLGFEPTRYPGSGYAVLRRRGVEIHYTQGHTHDDPEDAHSHGPETGMAFVRLLDADVWHADFTESWPADSASPARLTAIEDKPWGMREFAVIDPNNNLIRFGQTLEAK
jgi:catechol 2,3-dioxygenase-like lactoylglutathione lyase family enzyme